jgi:hypothetical protein
LLVFNLSTFPKPPGDTGLIDVGPLVGLWYLAVALRIWSSMRWIEAAEQRALKPSSV